MYDLQLVEKFREKLKGSVEKKMFGGLAFMLNDKLCVAVKEDKTLIRYNPERHEEVIKKKGYIEFSMKQKSMIGWLYVENKILYSTKNFDYWLEVALEENKRVKKKKK